MEDVFVAIGSNNNNPEEQVEKAIKALETLENSQLVKSSSLYRSKAIGPATNDFVNAVCWLQTSSSAAAFFRHLQALENSLGREKNQRWGNRSIDLDLVLYGKQIIDYPFLRVPHPQFYLRNFVVIPLLELVPDLQLPFGIRLDALSNKHTHDGLSRLDD